MSAGTMPDQAEPVTANSIAFELAGNLAAVLLNHEAMGAAFLAADMAAIEAAATEFSQLVDESRAALVRFHGWVEA